MAIVVLSILFTLSVVVNIFLGIAIYFANSLLKQSVISIKLYEEALQTADSFYIDTLENIKTAEKRIKILLERRNVFTLDPDVKELHSLIEEIYNFLQGYLNAKNERNEER